MMNKLAFGLVVLAASLIALGPASANYYVTPGHTAYVTPAYGYGNYYSGYTGYYGGGAARGVYDGQWGLADPSPRPYPAYAPVEVNRLSYGQYSRFTGQYHHPYYGTPMPVTWQGYGRSNAIPARAYPYTWSTLHRG
jgi:hypothetical protein